MNDELALYPSQSHFKNGNVSPRSEPGEVVTAPGMPLRKTPGKIPDLPSAFMKRGMMKNPKSRALPELEKLAGAVDREKVLSVLVRVMPYLHRVAPKQDDQFQKTRDAYICDIAHFIAWCALNKFNFSQVTCEIITKYVIEAPSSKVERLSSRSMDRRLVAVRHFFEALIEHWPSPLNAQRNPVQKRHFSGKSRPFPNPLPFRTALGFIGSIQNPTDRALFAFLLYTGCREDELATILFEDTSWTDDSKVLNVRVRKGKGRQERTVYLGGPGLSILRDYLKAKYQARTCKPAPEDVLLCNHAGLPWTPRRIRKRFAFWKKKLESTYLTSNWTVHRLRHTLLSQMAHLDMNLFAIQKISGHRQLNTLLHYIETENSKTRASYHLTIDKLHE